MTSHRNKSKNNMIQTIYKPKLNKKKLNKKQIIILIVSIILSIAFLL